MVDQSGINTTAAESILNDIVAGNPDIMLLGALGEVDDMRSDLEAKASHIETVSSTDFFISSASSFSDTLFLAFDNEINFGELSIGVVEGVAVVEENGDRAVIGLEETQPDLDGQEYILTEGEVIYELGNV